MSLSRVIAAGLLAAALFALPAEASPGNARARELGVIVGDMKSGRLNAITDVPGVRVGSVTIVEGEDVRTGVTAVLPHGGNIFLEKVPAAVVVGNGFGKLVGLTQIRELGLIETPIILTNTLSVFTAAKALIQYTLGLPGAEHVRSVNPVAGECNDGWLNDIRGFHVEEEHVLEAIRTATAGAVAEGSAGAGTGTRCLGYKGGIGTSSRLVPTGGGEYTVGVLVQTNYGGSLRVLGVPVGRILAGADDPAKEGGGSCMIIVATDAPLSSRSLERLARRTFLGLARTGSVMSHGSGDYAIAFSTAYTIPHRSDSATCGEKTLRDGLLTPFFAAVLDATEEAVYNSIFMATDVTGRDGNVARRAPVEKIIAELKNRGVTR
jgi:D-aminopeptidase